MIKKSLLAAMLVLSISAFAAEESADILVTGQVTNSCTITAPGTLDFGAMTVNEQKTLTGQIQVTCNNGAAYTIKPHNATTMNVSGSKNGTSFNNSVSMTNVSSVDVQIGAVSLFKDSGATQAWSDSAAISGTGNAAAQSHDIAAVFVHDGTNYGNFSFTLRPTVVF